MFGAERRAAENVFEEFLVARFEGARLLFLRSEYAHSCFRYYFAVHIHTLQALFKISTI